jgi:hypothetical protein
MEEFVALSEEISGWIIYIYNCNSFVLSLRIQIGQKNVMPSEVWHLDCV